MKIYYNMDPVCKEILNKTGLEFEEICQLDGLLLERDIFLDIKKYQEVSQLLPHLKQILSSCILTSLHKNAVNSQRWPLLNLTRQILSFYKFKMTPVRKADGYTKDGTKKYKRFFLINKNINNIA